MRGLLCGDVLRFDEEGYDAESLSRRSFSSMGMSLRGMTQYEKSFIDENRDENGKINLRISGIA